MLLDALEAFAAELEGAGWQSLPLARWTPAHEAAACRAPRAEVIAWFSRFCAAGPVQAWDTPEGYGLTASVADGRMILDVDGARQRISLVVRRFPSLD